MFLAASKISTRAASNFGAEPSACAYRLNQKSDASDSNKDSWLNRVHAKLAAHEHAE